MGERTLCSSHWRFLHFNQMAIPPAGSNSRDAGLRAAAGLNIRNTRMGHKLKDFGNLANSLDRVITMPIGYPGCCNRGGLLDSLPSVYPSLSALEAVRSPILELLANSTRQIETWITGRHTCMIGSIAFLYTEHRRSSSWGLFAQCSPKVNRKILQIRGPANLYK